MNRCRTTSWYDTITFTPASPFLAAAVVVVLVVAVK